MTPSRQARTALTGRRFVYNVSPRSKDNMKESKR